MGEVYSARDSRIERTVAIKVLRSDVAADPNYRKRFLQEARATARFSHPGIATFYEANESGDCLYLAMEYVVGHTLQQELIKGPLRSRPLADYSLQIASAIDHAHARGIIHRDIKPSNIMITETGMIKLLDFGLAQNILPRDETATALTAAGTFVGTLHYCAPEVLAGRVATVRSDIYNIGVLMYEMACGRLPFGGLDGPGLITAALRGQVPPVRERNPAVPELFARLIARTMALEPRDRFPNAGELAAALRSLADGSGHATIVLERARPLIAVLDFENLSGDSTTDWLGTGLAETITNDLRRLNAVQVVSRERVQHELRQDHKDVSKMASRLNARWLVTGSYQRAGTRIRIAPKLLEPASGDVKATEKVDGAWEEIFELQDRVVSQIIRVLEIEMDPSARHRIAAPETLRLEAYEEYVQGRKSLETLEKDSVEKARRHFECAIELDDDYAIAYCALGQTYAMRWIHRNDPDDLTRAAGCLERSLDLDPELGDPYAILCYVYGRQNKLEECLQAGLKAIRHNPDLSRSHYFFGYATWTVGQEISDVHLQTSAESFLRSVEIDPAHSPGWLNAGTLAMHTGAYDRAEQLFLEVMRLQYSNPALSHLPFAEMMLAGISMRRRQWGKALEWHERGLQYLAGIDNVYRETAIALNVCGMADVQLRLNSPDEALASLHRAWRMVKEFPRMMAHNRVLTRTMAGLAAVYAANGERKRAELLRDEASAHLEAVFANPGGFIHGALTFELCHALAVAQIRLGDLSSARELLAKAVEKGCRDFPWLASDPELASVRQDGGIEFLLERVRRFPPLRFSVHAKAA
jgi:serine/threonine protein kinase/tetratricopeptide (TPR) repeat protein